MIKVYAEGQLAGELFNSNENNQLFYFNYNRHCEKQNEVSLTMPFTYDPYPFTNGLHPIFDMNLPEGALLDKLNQLFRKHIKNFSDLDILKIVGQNQIGRLTFGQSPFNGAHNQNIGLNLDEFKSYTGSEELLAHLLDKYAQFSGISGVQPKVLIMDTSGITQNKLSDLEKLTYKNATHIIKSWSESSYPELAANEYFCMQAAKHANLPIPEIELTNNGKFLLVKRFDYINGIYYGFEDFCVLLGKLSAEKYDGSYERIANTIKNNLTGNSSVNLKSALYNYFKSLALSIAVRNGDAHLKNYGLIYKDTESIINLAPTYDIVTTTVYIPGDTMALTLNGTKRWPKRENLINFAITRCLMNKTEANNALEEIIHGIEVTKTQLIEYTNNVKEFKQLGYTILKIWEDGVANSIT